jgi:hypothetical protein
MKALFKINLSNQINDVMVNPRHPENPDSNHWLLRAKFAQKRGCIFGKGLSKKIAPPEGKG